MKLIDIVGVRPHERQKLEEIGVMTAGQFFIADPNRLAEATGIDAEIIMDWRKVVVGTDMTDTAVDALNRIKGIGPKRQAELSELGIISFVQFLHADTGRLAELLSTTEEQVEAWKASARLLPEVMPVTDTVRVQTPVIPVRPAPVPPPVEHLLTRKRPYGGAQ